MLGVSRCCVIEAVLLSCTWTFVCCLSAQDNSFNSSPANVFAESLTDVWELLPSDSRIALEKYIITAHTIEWLRDSIYGWSDTRKEPLLRHMHYEKFESRSNCSVFQCVLYVSTLSDSLQLWRVRGRHCFGLGKVQVSHLEELANSVVTSNKAPKGLYPPFNNGSKGIPELLRFSDETQCKRDLLHECSRGSVQMDPWLNRTLAFQRQLAVDLEINYVQFLGTHNSFNNKADGYGKGDFYLNELLEALSGGSWEFVWAQQWFTMTDQLNMGVRELMLDPVYVFDEMRLCHCGTTFKWVDAVIDWLDKVFNKTIHFDSAQLGCMPYDRALTAGLMEINDWLADAAHKEEFLLLHINDEGEKLDWGHIELVQQPVQTIFGKVIFTPLEKEKNFPSRWPTQRELLSLGKKIIVFSARAQNDFIFPDFTLPDWDKDTVKYFTPYPTCGGYAVDQWYIVGGESQVVGPLYNGPKEEGLVVLENLPYLLQCGVSITSMDLVSPPLLRGAVWSWSLGHPDSSKGHCAALNLSDSGHWVTLPCTTQLPAACQSTRDQYKWQVSTNATVWQEAQCMDGFQFQLPVSGHQNWILVQAAARLKAKGTLNFVWVHYKVNGTDVNVDSARDDDTL